MISLFGLQRSSFRSSRGNNFIIFLVFLWKHFRKSVFDFSIFFCFYRKYIQGRFSKHNFEKRKSKIHFNLPRQRRQNLIGWLKHNLNYSIVVSSRNPQRNTDNPRSYPNESWMESRILDSQNRVVKSGKKWYDEITLKIRK